MNGIRNPHITAQIDTITPYSFQMMYTFRMSSRRNNNFYIFRESFRQPECDIGLLTCLTINKSIYCLDDDHYFLVYLLRTVYDLLFFYLWTNNIQPVGKKFSDVLFQQIHTLFQLQCLFQFDNDLVQWIEVVAVITTSTCKVHNCEDLLFATLIWDTSSFLPLAQYCLHSAARLSFEDECAITLLFEPTVDFVYVLFLSRPYFFGLIVMEYCFAGTIYIWYYSMYLVAFPKIFLPQSL